MLIAHHCRTSPKSWFSKIIKWFPRISWYMPNQENGCNCNCFGFRFSYTQTLLLRSSGCFAKIPNVLLTSVGRYHNRFDLVSLSGFTSFTCMVRELPEWNFNPKRKYTIWILAFLFVILMSRRSRVHIHSRIQLEKNCTISQTTTGNKLEPDECSSLTGKGITTAFCEFSINPCFDKRQGLV